MAASEASKIITSQKTLYTDLFRLCRAIESVEHKLNIELVITNVKKIHQTLGINIVNIRVYYMMHQIWSKFN